MQDVVYIISSILYKFVKFLSNTIQILNNTVNKVMQDSKLYYSQMCKS